MRSLLTTGRRGVGVAGQNGRLKQAADKYFDARLAALRKHACAARDHFGIEAIHELRVETKRLRALFHLVKALDADFKSGYTRTGLKRMYKAAGVLRDVHVQQQRLRKTRQYLKLSEYYNTLTAAELSARPPFEEAAESFSTAALSRARKRMARALAKPATIDAFAERIGSSLDELSVLSRRRNPSVATLHEIRKAAKELHYLLEIWSVAQGSTAAVRKSIGTLRAMHQALGRWRDTKLLSRTLQAFLAHGHDRSVRDRAAYRSCIKALDIEAADCLRIFRQVAKGPIPTPEKRGGAPKIGEHERLRP